MKIAVIGSRGYPYVYSGYETFVKETCERLVKMGVEITVYCHKNLFNEHPSELNGIKLKYFYTPQKKSLAQLVHSFQSIVHATFNDFDLILVVNSANGPLGLITKLFRKKTLINVDGLEWLRPKWKGLGAKYFYWASKMAVKYFDVVINDSEEMRKYYLKEFIVDSEVIAYGANIRFTKNPEMIKKWDLSPRSYYLVVGRLIPDNNADLICQEFINSKSKKSLVIVGDVPYQDAYANKIKSFRDTRLLFTGYITDQNELAELYHHCYAYLHGHEFGGTNPTLLKALAYGCAPIALDTIFNKEVLNGYENGLYFNKVKNNLKLVIEAVETNPNSLFALKEKARKRIEDNYTWEKIATQYLNLFKKLMNNS